MCLDDFGAFIIAITQTPDAILGKTFFSQVSPGTFGHFDVALVSMFCVAAGMGWPPVRAGNYSDPPNVCMMPLKMQALAWASEEGTINFGTVFFVCSFVLIVNWTLLQICVAVLLETFISTRRRREEERLFGRMEDLIGLGMIRHPLDPLLEGLAREYTDDADLSRRLKELFEVNQ